MKNITRILTSQIDSIELEIENLSKKKEELKSELDFIKTRKFEFEQENKREQLLKTIEELNKYADPIKTVQKSEESISDEKFNPVELKNVILTTEEKKEFQPVPNLESISEDVSELNKVLEPELEPFKILKSKKALNNFWEPADPMFVNKRAEKLNSILNNVEKNKYLIFPNNKNISPASSELKSSENNELNNNRKIIVKEMLNEMKSNKNSSYSIENLRMGDYNSIVKKVNTSIANKTYLITHEIKKTNDNFKEHVLIFKNYGNEFKEKDIKSSNVKMSYFEIDIYVSENIKTNSLNVRNAFLLSQENCLTSLNESLPNANPKLSKIDLISFVGFQYVIGLFRKLSELYIKDSHKSIFETNDTFVHNGF